MMMNLLGPIKESWSCPAVQWTGWPCKSHLVPGGWANKSLVVPVVNDWVFSQCEGESKGFFLTQRVLVVVGGQEVADGRRAIILPNCVRLNPISKGSCWSTSGT